MNKTQDIILPTRGELVDIFEARRIKIQHDLDETEATRLLELKDNVKEHILWDINHSLYFPPLVVKLDQKFNSEDECRKIVEQCIPLYKYKIERDDEKYILTIE